MGDRKSSPPVPGHTENLSEMGISAGKFSLRDVFDFGFVLDQDPRAICDHLEVLTAKSDMVSLRLERLQALGPFAAQARAALDPLPRGVPYLESAMEKVMEFLERR